MNWIGAIRRRLAELLGLVFPARCGGCEQVLPPAEGALCAECGSAVLSLIDMGYCNRCGQDTGPYALRPSEDDPAVRHCGLCDPSLYRYSALARVGPYSKPLDGLIRQFKYHGGRHLAGLLGEWQSARLAAQPWAAGLDGFVPVPLHWLRRLDRGFNQSELLADVISRRLGTAVLDVLTRPVNRRPQAGLPRSRRFENVRGAFDVRRGTSVSGLRLCLIDDVCTTGATLSEAARTLRTAGADTVYASVVAVAQPPTAFGTRIADPTAR